MDGERVVAGVDDVAVPEVAHRGLQLGRRDFGRGCGGGFGRRRRRRAFGRGRGLGVGAGGRFVPAAGRGGDQQGETEDLERRIHGGLRKGVADATGAIMAGAADDASLLCVKTTTQVPDEGLPAIGGIARFPVSRRGRRGAGKPPALGGDADPWGWSTARTPATRA